MRHRHRWLWLWLWLAGAACLMGPRALAEPVTGIYRLTPRGQPAMALDVKDFQNTNGAAVILWHANQTSNQQWLAERQAEGTYKICAYSAQNSLQVLDYANGHISIGTAVTTWEDTGSNNQRWYIKPAGSGYYRLIPKNAGASGTATLSIRNGDSADAGNAVELTAYTGGLNQVFKMDWSGPSRVLPNPKKGLGGRHTKAPAVNASWFYTWGGDRPTNTPTGVEFVPMSWGYYGNANNDFVNWLNRVVGQPGVSTILAFNEPDHTDQANLPVASALAGYQYMAALGIPVGSPACADDNSQWMRDFMSTAAQRGYRVDFVCLHSYDNNAWSFLGYVDYIHTLYGKPLWITEFAPADWTGTRAVTVQQAMDWMRIVVPELNRRPYVLRYAWFSADVADNYLGTAGLVNDDGTLTDLGRLYGRM